MTKPQQKIKKAGVEFGRGFIDSTEMIVWVLICTGIAAVLLYGIRGVLG